MIRVKFCVVQTANFTHHFLIAMPGMVDTHFAKTLTYICEHSDRGAIGLVVNKPTDISIGHLFQQCSIALDDPTISQNPVHFGGPVKIECGFVLHQPLGDWKSTLKVDADIGMTTSKDILEAIAEGNGPDNIIVTLGYAGWAAGQLEDEIKQNGWLVVAADSHLIFDLPDDEKFSAALLKLGVRPEMLSSAVGNA